MRTHTNITLKMVLPIFWASLGFAQIYPGGQGPYPLVVPSQIQTRQDNYRGPAATSLAPDVWYDCDPNEDWGKLFSLEMLLNLSHRGEINLVMVTVQSTNWFAPASFDSILRYHGFDHIPISTGDYATVVRNPADSWGLYVATNYFNVGGLIAPYTNALSLVRQVLSTRPDHSVVGFWEGQLENPFDIFNSPADSISTLTGKQLMEQKMKYIGVVAGIYPTPTPGYEGNLYFSPAKAQLVNELTNIPVIWTSGSGGDPGGTGIFGWTEGVNICSNFWARVPYDDPCRWAALNYMSAHPGVKPYEPAWAQIMGLYIARGTNSMGTNWFGLQMGSNYVTALGSNIFSTAMTTTAGQAYITPTLTTNQYVSTLESLIFQPPIPGRAWSYQAWTPQNLQGLDMWLEADSSTPALATGTQLQFGLDLSGKPGQLNFSGNSGQVPTNIVNILNGKPVYQFAAATQTIWSSASVDSSVPTWYVAAIIYVTNAANINGILTGTTGNMAVRVNANKIDILQEATLLLGSSSAGTIQNNTWYLMEASYNGATGGMSFWTNGVACGTASNLQTFGSTFGSYIGSERGVQSPFGGYIAAILKTHILPTSTDQQNLRNWWNSTSKWHIY